jgi:hypothetical protein
MSKSWRTMRILRESPELERLPRSGLRGLQAPSWQRPDLSLDELILSRSREKSRSFRASGSRVGAAG